MYSSWTSQGCHPKDTILLLIQGSELPCYKKTNTIFTQVCCHQATSVWTDFHSVNLSGGQQEKDAHSVILRVGYEFDQKAQELDLMILVNSVQLRIVYILSFHLEKSCINAMWTVTQSKSQNQWRSFQRRSFQRTVKLRIPKYKKSTVALLSTLRIICEMPWATLAMVHPTQLSASNSRNWRNHLGRTGLAFPSAPKHPEWLHLGYKNKNVPT